MAPTPRSRLETLTALEGGRVRGGKDLRQNLHGSTKRVFEQLALSGDEAVLPERGFEGRCEGWWVTGFGQEAEDVAVIHCIGGGLLVGVAGEHESSGVRCRRLGLL